MCEPFVRRLSEAADALTTRNRKLRSVHLTVSNHVAQLLDMSLYKQRDNWVETVAKINAIFIKEAQCVVIYRLQLKAALNLLACVCCCMLYCCWWC